MFRLSVLLAPLIFVVAAGAPPVHASQPAATAENVISIPFDPPLGVTLTYRSTRSSSRNGRPESVTLDIRVTFARNADGYVMTVVSDLPPEMPPGEIATILARPFSVRLTREGELIGLADEAGFWVTLDSAMALIMRGLPNATERGAIETMMARLRALPHDELIAFLCQRVSPIFGLAGRELPTGEMTLPDTERDSLIGRMTMQIRLINEATADDMARITLITTVPPDQLARLGSNLQRDFSPARQGGSVPRLTSYEERSVSLVSRRTGLAESWISIREIISEENGTRRSAAQTEELRLVH